MSHEVVLTTSDGRRSIIIDDAFCKSLGTTEFDNKESLSLFIASWLVLLTDSPLGPNGKPFSLYRKFITKIRSNGIATTVMAFSDLSHKLVSNHLLMGSSSSIGEWISEFKDTPVFFEYNRYYKTGNVDILRYLYTFLNFGKKLEYVDTSFYETAFRGWIDNENRLNDLVLDDKDTSSLKYILSSLLPPFSFSDFRPSFGPGSVSEKGVRYRIDKLDSFSYDYLIDRFLFHGHIGKYGYGEDSGLSYQKVIPLDIPWPTVRDVSSRTSRLHFVPKNMKTSRSICMEPNVLMFFQQGIEREMRRAIRCSYYRNIFDIEHQSRNQDLANFGSFTTEIDTLDLSSASDLLSYDLVKKVFPPSWQIPMRVSRSSFVLTPDGNTRYVKKFAPMGSALCFPTQSLIFGSVCIYAACLYVYEVEHVDSNFLDWIHLNLKRVLDLIDHEPHSYSDRFQPIAVYGDDICIDRRLTSIVKSILSRLGFLVNDSKSFTGSQAFRESCGKFFLDGNDISPLYFRVKGVRRKLTPSHVVSHVHLINECRIRGYKKLHHFLHHSLMTWDFNGRKRNSSIKPPIPYVSDPSSFGILVASPSNSHLKKRYNKDYQKDELKSWTISYETRIDPLNLLGLVDRYEYMRWWASRNDDFIAEDSFSVHRYDTANPGIRWRWIPAD